MSASCGVNCVWARLDMHDNDRTAYYSALSHLTASTQKQNVQKEFGS